MLLRSPYSPGLACLHILAIYLYIVDDVHHVHHCLTKLLLFHLVFVRWNKKVWCCMFGSRVMDCSLECLVVFTVFLSVRKSFTSLWRKSLHFWWTRTDEKTDATFCSSVKPWVRHVIGVRLGVSYNFCTWYISLYIKTSIPNRLLVSQRS